MTRVRHRKLGREKAYGIAHTDLDTIEIDKNRHKTNKSVMDTYIHEALHIAFPELSETGIKKATKIIRDVLWDQGYRIVEL